MLEVDGYQIPAALTLPEGKPDWAILLIPGSLFLDIDGNFPTWNIFPHTYADLANQLAELGYAVLRFAKTGPGTGAVIIDPEKAKVYRNFGQRVVVAGQALKALQEKVPGVRLAVAGHSEGGLVGSLLCNKLGAEVAAFIDLSGPAYPIFDIMLKQNEAMAGANPNLICGRLSNIGEGARLSPPSC
jgi:predicted alpha/beta hydrolase